MPFHSTIRPHLGHVWVSIRCYNTQFFLRPYNVHVFKLLSVVSSRFPVIRKDVKQRRCLFSDILMDLRREKPVMTEVHVTTCHREHISCKVCYKNFFNKSSQRRCTILSKPDRSNCQLYINP